MNFLVKFSLIHPYLFSFILSCLLLFVFLFYSSTTPLLDKISPTEAFEFIDFDKIQSPKKIVKQEISIEDGEVSDAKIVEKSTGTSDLQNAVDIDFVNGVVPPKPLSKLKMIFPKSAKDKNIEATVIVKLTIAPTGLVKRVQIIGESLSKQIPPGDYKKISKSFHLAANKILLGARFSPPIVNGKQVVIKMEFPLKFTLTN